MTVITPLNVRLGMDASNFRQGVDLARSEVNRVATVLRQSVPPAEKFKREVGLLDRAFSEAGKSTKQYENALDFLLKKYQQGQYSAEVMARAQREKAAADAAAAEQAKRQAAAEAEAKRRLAAEEARLIQLGKEGEAVTRSLFTAEQRYSAEVRKLNELLRTQSIGQAAYSQAVKRARAELDAANPATQRHNQLLAEGRQLTQSLLSPMERHARELERLNRLHRAGAIDGVTYRRAMEQADATLKKHNATVQATSSSSGMLVGRIKSMVAAYVGFQTITKSIQLAVEVEQASAAFEVLTGSVNNARVMMQQVRDFSDVSPLTFSGAQAAAKQMLAFNIPVQEVARNLKMLGDISGGNQQRFDMLTLAFSQMSAAGRMMGQDLLQMINAGFNPLQVISEKTGESLTDLKKRMEEGQISAQEVTEAFISATSEGGRFHGLTERLAQTMGGKMSIAMANLEKSGAALGEALSPLVISLTEGFEKGNSQLQGLISLVGKFADGVGFASALVTDLWNNIASGGTRGENRFKAINALLDQLDQRDRERAERARQSEAAGGFDAAKGDAPMAGMNAEAVKLGEAFDKQLQTMKLQVAELTEAEYVVDRLRWQYEGFSDPQIEQLERQAEFLRGLKEEQELLKKNTTEAKKAAEAFDRGVSSAHKAAMDHFAKERERDARMRAEISRGPGSGLEVGSAGAAKFMADQVNAKIGAAAVPQKPTPGEEAILKESQRQFELQRAANAKHDQQIATLKELLDEFRDNGFGGVG